MNINIQDGTNSIQLGGDLVFDFSGFRASPLNTTVTVEPDYDFISDELRTAYGSGFGFVTSINGVAATDRGEFFIAGSECDSWEYGDTGELKFYDLCPACTTCETIYRLKYETENLKQWINTLRDVNLMVANDVYNNSVALATQRITGATTWSGSWMSPTMCGLDPRWNSCMGEDTPVDDSFMRLRGLDLLRQYITTVHMWNYVVSLNNASTEIQVAPEDTAGFVVQTKRALPSCCDKQRISCEIKVTDCQAIYDNDSDQLPSDLPGGYNLSVYVPERTTRIEFQPFTNKIKDATGESSNMKAILCAPLNAQPEAYNFEAALWDGVVTDIEKAGIPVKRYYQQMAWMSANYQKAIYTTVLDAKVAGTYILTAKFLPFIGMELYNGKNQIISIRGGTYSAKDGTKEQDDETDVQYKFIDHEQDVVYPNPTETNYLDSKAAPTRSVNFKLVWTIEVNWKIETHGQDPEEINQTYQYTCNGCRQYYGAAILSGSTISNIVVPVTGGTTGGA